MLLKFIAGLAVLSACNAATDRVICYYQSWAYYGPGDGEIKPETLDPSLCTHVNYAFISLREDGSLEIEDEYLDVDERLFLRTTGLKKKNPNLKVLLSIGGANEERTYAFADIARNPTTRAKFIQSASSIVTKYNFDGVDVDWEYPEEDDKEDFITLLRELYEAFHSKGWLVTAAVRCYPSEGYNVPEMAKYLDQINIMAYDMYGDWSDYIGQNSPLYSSSKESEWEKSILNVASAIKNWKNAGVDPSKLNLGLAFYGRAFGLADPNKHGIHDRFNGPAEQMPYTQDGWSYSYAEICQYTKDWTTVWDSEQQVPYKYNSRNWVGYDDEKSITLKVQKAVSEGLGGVMMWSVDQDDVHGRCGQKFGLLRAIHAALGN